MITEARIRIINSDFRGHHQVEALKRLDNDTDASIERRAHVRAAELLQALYPGEWCYRYGNLRGGDDMPLNADKLDGVINMDWIADGGFRGQFQWNNYWRGSSNLVPATVDTVDPDRDARYAAERKAREREAENERQALYAKVEALPPFQPKDDEAAALWQSWAEVNKNTIFLYAENWARLMQSEINSEFGLLKETDNPDFVRGAMIAFGEIAERTSHEADVDGMSGATHGIAQQALIQAWVYGDALRAMRDGKYVRE